MRRIVIGLSIVASFFAIGCGDRSYETRLARRVDQLKYIQKLDKNLNPPTNEPFKKENIYLRPPKGMEIQTVFPLGETKGIFDAAASYSDLQKGASGLRLHVVARIEKPKKPPGKNATAPQENTPRGSFTEDLKALLIAGYGSSDALESPAYKPDTAKSNSFKRLIFPTDKSKVEVYVYQKKPYDVALIWEIPNGLNAREAVLAQGKPLSLESFAVGSKAIAYFNSGVDEEGGGGRAGSAESTGQAF
jgi:hypothetical protein